VKTPCVMVIDAGTGSARALVFDTNGRQMAAAQREWVFPSIPQYPGSREFDTAGSWGLICDCIREASRQATAQDGDVAAVTATSMREGMVLYDAQNREIWACPNIDARAASEADELVAEGLAAEIYETAGDWLGIISPPRFRWLRRHRPEILDTARQMSMISDWVLFKLCGQIATDPSSGSSSGLFDLRLRRWSETLAARLGLPPHLFPPVRESGTVLGSITRGAAA
jgi:autoinducer-2 kinase